MILKYFFIMFYKGLLKTDHSEFSRLYASAVYGLLVTLNAIVVFTFLSKLDLVSFPFKTKYSPLSLQFIVTIIIFIYFSKSRINSLLVEFSNEKFLKKRRSYNYIFVIYLVLSIVLVFVGPFYKPGYLP